LKYVALEPMKLKKPNEKWPKRSGLNFQRFSKFLMRQH